MLPKPIICTKYFNRVMKLQWTGQMIGPYWSERWKSHYAELKLPQLAHFQVGSCFASLNNKISSEYCRWENNATDSQSRILAKMHRSQTTTFAANCAHRFERGTHSLPIFMTVNHFIIYLIALDMTQVHNSNEQVKPSTANGARHCHSFMQTLNFRTSFR